MYLHYSQPGVKTLIRTLLSRTHIGIVYDVELQDNKVEVKVHVNRTLQLLKIGRLNKSFEFIVFIMDTGQCHENFQERIWVLKRCCIRTYYICSKRHLITGSICNEEPWKWVFV
ncbi:hypothetical protein MTR_3g467310 [Medicago truncatula]|uniref:Uncharacterized protein n=1 Tax=Medicago truncatula TaxID=3880 RepID=A0A072UY47_MEDTR|nr:hypothetical protein MTR_3g467310 [Medicago truncatula]